MAKLSKLRSEMSKMESLERELHLKQLQINRLLNITQAINSNVSDQGLYDMYNSFLSWEMGINKMALYIQSDKVWKCISYIGIPKKMTEIDITEKLKKYDRLKMLEGNETHELIKEFDVVIPVLHKEHPIAYTFIGGFEEDEDRYNKVQFITTITNIIAVAIENKRLFKQQIEQEIINREMELAGEMQQLLIPDILPDNKYYQLDSIYKPHQMVGGDYFDYVEFKDGTLVFCIADIAGKGLAAALLMANFQANFHSILMASTALETFVRELNTSLYRITKGDKHLTFFIGVYKSDTRKLTYCNAGHNPPVMFSKNKMDTLREGCTILGSFPELPFMDLGEVSITEDTTILTYTDGLTDMQNDAEEYFDEEVLQEFVKNKTDLSAKEFNQQLINHIEIFKGRQNYPDDFTVLTCKIFK